MDFYNELQERCRVSEELNRYHDLQDSLPEVEEITPFEMALDMCTHKLGTVERDQYEMGVEDFIEGADAEGVNIFYLTGYLNAGLALNQYNELMGEAA